MRKLYFFLFVLLICGKGFFSQTKIDSLKNLVYSSANEDSVKLDLLTKISTLYKNEESYDSALYYSLKTDALAKKLINKKAQAKNLLSIGAIYREKGQYDEGFKVIMTAQDLYTSLDNKKGITDAEYALGLLFLRMKNYNKAEYYLLTAIKDKIEIGDTLTMYDIHSKLGAVYLAQKRTERAIKELETSISLCQKLGNERAMAANYGSLGRIYFEKMSYDTALTFFEKALKLGIKYKSKAIQIRSYTSIGNIYFEQGNYKKAQSNFEEFYKLALEIGDINAICISHQNFYKVYEKLGDSKKALYHYKLYNNLNDSLLKIENDKNINEISLLTETKKRDDKINQLKIQNELTKNQLLEKQQNQRLIILGSLFIISIALFTFIAIIRNSKHKQKMRVEQMEKEKVRAELDYLKTQMSPHVMFNSLNAIFFQIDEHKEDAKEMILLFADLLRYQLYECNVEYIEIEKEINYIEKFIAAQRMRKSKRCEISFINDRNIKDMQIAPMLLIPLVENAFKYVSNDKDTKNFIHISLSKINNQLVFNVKNTTYEQVELDNKFGGIGLSNLRNRLELIYPGKHRLNITQNETIFNAELIIHV